MIWALGGGVSVSHVPWGCVISGRNGLGGHVIPGKPWVFVLSQVSHGCL